MTTIERLNCRLTDLLNWLRTTEGADQPGVVINPCPRCGRRCDFVDCECVDGCPGSSEHLNSLSNGKWGSR